MRRIEKWQERPVNGAVDPGLMVSFEDQLIAKAAIMGHLIPSFNRSQETADPSH
jgi:hypothetical protein